MFQASKQPTDLIQTSQAATSRLCKYMQVCQWTDCMSVASGCPSCIAVGKRWTSPQSFTSIAWPCASPITTLPMTTHVHTSQRQPMTSTCVGHALGPTQTPNVHTSQRQPMTSTCVGHALGPTQTPTFVGWPCSSPTNTLICSSRFEV